MTAPGTGLVAQALSEWTDRARRHARATVFVAIPVTGLLVYYAATHLEMDTDTGSMISERLPWRQAFLSYERAFPQFGDEIQVVIHGVTLELAERAQRELAERLREAPDLFEEVFLPGGGPFFDRNGLLYLSVGELEDLRRSVARFRPWIVHLERSPTIRGLVEVLDSTTDELGRGEEIDISPILVLVGRAFQAQLQRQFYQISWRDVLEGRASTRQERRRFIILKPRLDYSNPLPAGPAIRRIRDAADELRLDWRRGVRMRITGSEAIEHESLESAMKSTARLGPAALLAVALVLYAGLRSVRLLFASLATLVAGLSATAAFAAFAVGRLNLISIAFAILYIGLGIDYAVHLCLGYAEALGDGHPHAVALRQATQRVGSSLVLSALTTAACFYAFIPTDFIGVSELGLISGTGMLISLFATLTLLPALLSLTPLRIEPSKGIARRLRVGAGRGQHTLHELLQRRRRAVLGLTALAGLASLALLPRIKFDHNPLNLSDPDSESVTTYRGLAKDRNTVPLTVSAVAGNPEDARALAARLARLASVQTTLTADDLVPGEQPLKLPIIAEIGTILGPPQEDVRLSRATADARSNRYEEGRLEAIDDLRRTLARYRGQQQGDRATALGRLGFLIGHWRRWLDEWPPETRRRLVETLEESLVGAIPVTIESLRTALEAQPFGLADLPAELRDRWVSRERAYRVQVVSRETLDTSEALKRFVEAVRAEAPEVTGIPVNDLESARVAVGAFRRALSLAVLATALVLLLLLRQPAPAMLVLGPLLLAGLLTFGASVALNLPLNFANIIALPLLLGVGVDNGIHVIHRARVAPLLDDDFYATSTARAVLFSSLTTTASFGNLALSSHYGLASMGQLLTIGMLNVLFCTLVVLPVLLATFSRVQPKAFHHRDESRVGPGQIGNREALETR